MGRLTDGAREILRVTFAREELPEAPATGPSRRPPGFVAQLLRSEPFPPDLPPARPPGAPRTGLLAALFAPEPLPPDLPPAPHRPGRWLAWLFGPEKLDP